MEKVNLCNRVIAEQYRDWKEFLMPSDFIGAFAYWVSAQQSENSLIRIGEAVNLFKDYIKLHFKNPKVPQEFNYEDLESIINEEAFMGLPSVLALGEVSKNPDMTSVDLGALARNVFYMIIRQTLINQ